MDVVTQTGECSPVKQKSKRKKRLKQMLTTFMMAFILTFSVIGFTNSDQASATWWDNAKEWVWAQVDNAGDALTGAPETVGQAMYNAKKGGAWRYGEGEADGDSGVYKSKSSPIADKKFKSATRANRTAFVAWGDWATRQRLRVSYVGIFDSLGQIVRMVFERWLGGAILMSAYLFSSIIAWFGLLIYKMLDVFNFFKYLVPNYSLDGGFQMQGGMAWAQPIVDLFGGFRQLGVVIAMLMFIVSLSAVFFIQKNGRGRKAKSAFGRFFLSIFSLTMMTVMLSSMISGFASWMNDTDDMGQDQAVGSLIFSYKDWVYAPYSTDFADSKDSSDDGGKEDNKDNNKEEPKDEAGAKRNEMFLYPASIENKVPGSNTQLLGTQSSYRVPNTLSKDQGSRNAGAVSPAMVYSMNHASGALSSDVVDAASSGGITTAMATSNAEKHLNSFTNSDYMSLIMGWMTGATTGSAEVGATFGGKSGATAQYLTQFDMDNQTMQRQVSDAAMNAVRTYDYTIPGGITAGFRWLKSVGLLISTALFSFTVYLFIATAIFDMWRMIISRLPAAMGFGSLPAIVLIFEAVIIMMIQVVIGRVVITLYTNIVGGTLGQIFTGLFDVTHPQSVVAATVYAAGGAAGVKSMTDGVIILDSLTSVILAIVLFQLFRKMYSKIGSELGRIAAEYALKLSGVDKDSTTGKRMVSDLSSVGTDHFGRGVIAMPKNAIKNTAGKALEVAGTGLSVATGAGLAGAGVKSAIGMGMKAAGKSAITSNSKPKMGLSESLHSTIGLATAKGDDIKEMMNTTDPDSAFTRERGGVKKAVQKTGNIPLSTILGPEKSAKSGVASLVLGDKKMKNTAKDNLTNANQAIKSLARENGQSVAEFMAENPNAKSAILENMHKKDQNGVTNAQKVKVLKDASKSFAKYNDAQSQANTAKANLDALRKKAEAKSAMSPQQQLEVESQIADAETKFEKANANANLAKSRMQTSASQAKAYGIKLNTKDGGASANAALTAATHALAGQSVAAIGQNGEITAESTVAATGAINSKAISTIAQNPSKQAIGKLSASNIKAVGGTGTQTVHNKVNVNSSDRITGTTNSGGPIQVKGQNSTINTTSTANALNNVKQNVESSQGNISRNTVGSSTVGNVNKSPLEAHSTRTIKNTRNINVQDVVSKTSKENSLDTSTLGTYTSKTTQSTETVTNHVKEKLSSEDVMGSRTKGSMGTVKQGELNSINSSRDVTNKRTVNVRDNVTSQQNTKKVNLDNVRTTTTKSTSSSETVKNNISEKLKNINKTGSTSSTKKPINKTMSKPKIPNKLGSKNRK